MYSTKSLFLASFLYSSSNVEFKGVDDSDPQNILFNFYPEDKAKDLIDEYYTESGFNCNAKKLFEAQKSLKDRIFEAKRQYNS
jgi:hypothetical protein